MWKGNEVTLRTSKEQKSATCDALENQSDRKGTCLHVGILSLPVEFEFVKNICLKNAFNHESCMFQPKLLHRLRKQNPKKQQIGDFVKFMKTKQRKKSKQKPEK